MIDTCFANNPNLLAALYSLGAKVTRCIWRYLASHKYGGETTTANKPQPFMHAKNGFLNHSFPFNLFCMGCSTKERLRNFKRRENREMKWQKEQEHRRMCFFIKSSLQLYSVFKRTKPCKITGRVFRRWHRWQEASERRTVPLPTPELVFHVSVSVAPGARFKVNLMQCRGWQW